MALSAVLTQTLLPSKLGGRVPAAELLMIGYGGRQHIRRNSLQHLNQEITMMINAHSAPTHGFAQALATTLASIAVRNPFKAVSTVVNGLSKIKMLIAFDARNTMKNTTIATGTIMAL